MDIDSIDSVTDVQDLHYVWDTVGNLTCAVRFTIPAVIGS